MHDTRRFKIRIADDDRFQIAREILRGQARLLVENEKRRYFSAMDLSDRALRELSAIDAEIIEEMRYDID